MPFCNDANEDIDHLFKDCRFTQQIWNIISEYCSNPKDGNMKFLDWIEFIHNQEKNFKNKLRRPLEKIVVITWSIWTHRNHIIFKNWKVNPAQIINLAGTVFHDMRYYNLLSNLFDQESSNLVRHIVRQNSSCHRF